MWTIFRLVIIPWDRQTSWVTPGYSSARLCSGNQAIICPALPLSEQISVNDPHFQWSVTQHRLLFHATGVCVDSSCGMNHWTGDCNPYRQLASQGEGELSDAAWRPTELLCFKDKAQISHLRTRHLQVDDLSKMSNQLRDVLFCRAGKGILICFVVVWPATWVSWWSYQQIHWICNVCRNRCEKVKLVYLKLKRANKYISD